MKTSQLAHRILVHLPLLFLSLAILASSGCKISGSTNFSGPMPLSLPSSVATGVAPNSPTASPTSSPTSGPSPNPVSTVTAGATGSVALSWSAPNSGGSVISYFVYQSTDKVNFTKVQTLTEAQTSTTVTGLTDGTIYYFYITAANAAGASLPSNSVTADVP